MEGQVWETDKKIFPVPLPQESFRTELLCPSPQSPVPGSKKKMGGGGGGGGGGGAII